MAYLHNTPRRGLMYDPEVQQRATLLPVGRDQMGNLVPAVPQGLLDFIASAKAIGSGAEPNVEDAFNVAGGLTLGGVARAAPRSFAESRPADLGIFAGVGAKTADRFALEQAEEMAARGARRDQILAETGWFQGPDGKWRFEIDDSRASRADVDMDSTSRLGEVLSHDNLFAAYPELAKISVGFENNPYRRGAYYPSLSGAQDSAMALSVTPDKDASLSTLLHEVQHAVQHREGFAPGSNKKMAKSDALAAHQKANWDSNARDAYYDWEDLREQALPVWRAQTLKRYEDLMSRKGIRPREIFGLGDWYSVSGIVSEKLGRMPKKKGPERDRWLQGAAQIMRDEYLKELGATNASNALAVLRAEAGPNDLKNRARRLERQLDKVSGGARKYMEFNTKRDEIAHADDFDLYQRAAGETEARNVQRRRGMTEGQRSAQPPWATQDRYDEELWVGSPHQGGALDASEIIRKYGWAGLMPFLAGGAEEN